MDQNQPCFVILSHFGSGGAKITRSLGLEKSLKALESGPSSCFWGSCRWLGVTPPMGGRAGGSAVLGFSSASLPAAKCNAIPVLSASQVSKVLLFSFQTLFGNKPAGFGATTTSAPSFGTTTGGGLFGNNPPCSGFGSPCRPFQPGDRETVWFESFHLHCVHHTLQRARAGYCSVGIVR